MPADNVAINSLVGKSKIVRLTTSYTTILTNIVDSNEIFRINTIMAVNDGVITPGVSLQFVTNNTSYSLAEAIQVPVKTNAIIVDRDLGLYLEEGNLLQAKSSINNTIVLVISYDSIASPNPSPYSVLSVVPDTNSLQEGNSFNIAVTTTNIASGNLYWVASGTVSDSDFLGGTAYGLLPITNNLGTATISIATNAQFEGSESFVISVRSSPDSAVSLANSSIIYLAESLPTATIIPSTTQVVPNCLRTITYAITTTNIQDNTSINWYITGNNLPGDFEDNVISGTAVVINNRADVSVTLSSSFNYANNKSIIFDVRVNNNLGTPVVIGTASTIIAATYSVTTSSYSVSRGGFVSFYLTTTNIPDDTVLYWQNERSTTGAADFINGATSGTVTIVGDSGVVSLTIADAAILESEQTIKLIFRLSSPTGYVVAVSPTVIVLAQFNEAIFSIPGTYTWLAPADTTSVNVVCVGGGGGGNVGPKTDPGVRASGGGGALAYKNNIPVTGGTSYTVVVGAAGTEQTNGGDSYFIDSTTLLAGGGGGATAGGIGGSGGTVTAPGGGGGAGGAGGSVASTGKGAGGAGGYAGAGGDGAIGSAGTGGAGGASIATTIGDGWGSPGGGGVGLFGQGTNGFGGAAPPGLSAQAWYRGGGGSGGQDGVDSGINYLWGGGGTGGNYGGGGGYGVNTQWGGGGGPGGAGAVRIIWGPNRSFPSTNVGEGSYTP